MAMLTLSPSRIAIVVVALTLTSLLYTLGFPTQLVRPAQPIIDHYEHKNVHTEPIVPAPVMATPTDAAIAPQITHGDGPAAEDDQRWNDAGPAAGQATETGIAEYEKDGGRWEDKDQLKAAETSGETRQTRPPTTLATHAIPAPTANATNATTPAKPKFCKDVAGAPNVMVVFRTSKAEVQEKLPAHIKSLLACVPNFAIFSDHDGSIDGIKVHNALDSIGSETKRTHDEFREYQLMHADAEHKPDVAKTKDLDKWKFLPMVNKAFHLKPDARFYVFIEADTSLSWTNLLQWLDRLDYRIPYYSGAPTFINNVQIAQRGPGILLSQGALRRYAKSYSELYASKWEPELGKGCCGDLALAQAMNDAHVEFYASWPLMQGEQPSTLDFTRKQWCAPAVSWHHTDATVLNDIWASHQNWTHEKGWDVPYLFRDAFADLVMPHVQKSKGEWDNFSGDTKIVGEQGRRKKLEEEDERRKQHAKDKDGPPEESPFADPPHNPRDDKDAAAIADAIKDAADSPEKCQKTCERVEDCLQWRYKALGDGECHLGKVLKLGRRVKTDEGWTSGWMIERLGEVTAGWECKEVNWKFYQ
ncbi:hypothetical protein HBI46_082430 [Parastagonospora nodorum]|nr:hypothetical protein HBI46_082430 [Parastagonospora nodorum]KAH5700831.1 hypothetical protein HBI44_051650 [Parastagonospora nodorum]KAH5734797.1 hypothetical protein HBI20_027800 [Parastagonospora nodorum]KAH6097420.1 hypothetical protein HBI65_084390 [Parastagonospora nodorum]KAH6131533.1 hypothetical protein HBI64_094560 [Parastagonospora nodorum]